MIQVENVTRYYGRTLAVDRVSFEIRPDEIVGFLGPNGAGKSTVLKMISTWLPPSSGRLSVAGFDVERQPLGVRRHLGYLPEHNALYDGMRVDRFLRFVARSHGLRRARLRERFEWAVERCALGEVLGKRARECSKGFRQRIGLAAALIHDPPVVVLDEPTHGLDPLQVVAFREFLKEFARGRTVLFSSHVLSEVVAISQRLLVIHHGRLLANRPLAEFEAQARQQGLGLEDVVLDLVRRQEASDVPA